MSAELERILKTAKGIIFDVDGTLLDSMVVWDKAGERYLESKGFQIDKELQAKLFSMGLEEAAEHMIRRYQFQNTKEEIVAEIVGTVCQAYEEEIPEKAGVKKLLAACKEAGIPMVLATSSERNVVLSAMRRLGLEQYFQNIFTCLELGTTKKQPDIYLTAAGYLGAEPEEIWVFEDAIHAAETAKQAGFCVAGVYDVVSEKDQKDLQAVADIYITSYEKLCGARKKEAVAEYDASELVRLNKFLSDAGVCSRRQADKLIEEGKVLVNGQVAVTGMKVDRNWEIVCEGKKVQTEEEFVLLAYHKPRGIETTTSREVAGNIVDAIQYPKRVYPIGRLDKDSEGLILLTNHGEIVNRILKASNYHEKEYEVTVNRRIDEEFIRRMSGGVKISKVEKRNGRKEVIFEAVTRKCKVVKTGEKSFRIVLTQGLNRQIRRMCEVCGAKVVTLKRIRIMNILLGDLKCGAYREVSEEELKGLLGDSYGNEVKQN